jgi:phosphoribosyl-ATP pyrophosphohydrolase
VVKERDYMAKHIIDKDNTLKALGSINTLLSQSLQIIKKVNEDEQWDFCTDDVLARRVNDAERLIKEISDVVFQNEKAK